ncbi:MAG: adenylosuccinate lyase [Flammeovirgaceae bacterium TMED290]|nr:MAG: adenylosuccinate lyase [Flammeovirgaceae bacterium TMED290]|tara:strand:+ start:3687 stop:5039 length:1353 start_codon:yes stop_codon:yes gene_type:complete
MNNKKLFLKAISPIDGRYNDKTSELSNYFSEYALMKYRVLVEIEYFIELSKTNIINLQTLSDKNKEDIQSISHKFNLDDAVKIKKIENEINHDVKAVEYFVKMKFDELKLSKYKEFIHFGLTSQDINNTALPLMIKDSIDKVLVSLYEKLQQSLNQISSNFKNISMISRTHGQPATPTTFGKEIKVFEKRLHIQLKSLSEIPHNGKFGGASGNLNAHYVAFPEINWDNFSKRFLKRFGLVRSEPTTQIEHYDNMASKFHNLSRINTILIDLCKDIWHYISINYLIQKVNLKEVGSSTMPHKVNPIDFENAEGNLMIANSQLIFLANKLPISRLQRDLTDSTVSRNIGVPLSHIKIALESLIIGLKKIDINKKTIKIDLESNWAVVSEAIQTILRRENIESSYEIMKDFTRGNKNINEKSIKKFINNLPVDNSIKKELLTISPENYLGNLK